MFYSSSILARIHKLRVYQIALYATPELLAKPIKLLERRDPRPVQLHARYNAFVPIGYKLLFFHDPQQTKWLENR